jgi:Flp pilus assembly pilin Flp
MLNLVEKYSAETAVESEDGVVAIEYVLMAALVATVVVALGVAFGGLADRLDGVIDTVVG